MAKYNYTHMTPAEFARSMDDIKEIVGMDEQGKYKFTLGRLSRILGMDYDELHAMSRGKAEIPHIVRVSLAMLVLGEARSIARTVTDLVIVNDKDFNYDAKFADGAAKRVAGAFK